MSDVASKMDVLLDRLAHTTDTESRDEISAELAQLNRQKVLAAVNRPSADEWKPIPLFRLGLALEAIPGLNTRDFIKGFFRSIVAGLDAYGGETPDEFVALCRFCKTDETVEMSIICPYQHPLQLLESVYWGPKKEEARALIKEKANGILINHRYGVPDEVWVPIVFSKSRDRNEVLLMNRYHLDNPKQFIVPARCTTTSDFLNFIGAIEIDHALYGHNDLHINEPELLMNRGLDDWFRWFYWVIENGTLFEPSRMYVNRSDPERYAYVYGASAEG
jgi:hypothetical protein